MELLLFQEVKNIMHSYFEAEAAHKRTRDSAAAATTATDVMWELLSIETVFEISICTVL